MGMERIITTTVLILALIIISTTTSAALSCSDCDICDICVNQSGWWHDGGALNASTTPIQAAVDNATAGETICVAAGSYTENVDVTTPHLSLRGEGEDVVTVNAVLSWDHVFEVTADYVNISGFNATGITGYRYAGINIGDVDHCNISENTASNNYYGICLSSSSNYNTLTNNTASNNFYGIYLDFSSNYNTLTNNTANSNKNSGIWLYSSNNYNTLMSNTANSNNYHGICLSSSSNNTLTNNIASSNYFNGIWLSSSSNNMLMSNTVNLNGNHGIYLSSSSNNTLANNNVHLNNDHGIYLSSSSDNLIYNNYFNNTNNVYDYGGNQWNVTKTNGTNIIDGPFLSGNYWSDYAGVDNDHDGLGDTLTPYNSSDYIINGGDYHPLVMLDNTPPPGITYLQNITHARTYINWTWTNPHDPDFNHTEIYLNGTFLTNIPAPQNYYNATGLLPDTSYELGTRTVDINGNINLTWVNDTASTLPASGIALNLYTGWNLISLPLMPEDTSITSLLSPINGNYSIVWEYNASDTSDHWKKYDPTAPFGNDLINMEPGKGYWIMMISDDTLPISGTVPELTDINLTIGWNLIGYNSFDGQPVADALSSISSNYTIVWAYDASDTVDHWKKYDPSAPFGNDLIDMEPRKGYWIMMTTDDILET